jgi:hypothetical protein
VHAPNSAKALQQTARTHGVAEFTHNASFAMSRSLDSLVLVTAGLLVLGWGGALSAHAQDAFVGSWAGSLEAGGAEVRVVFHIEQAEGDDLTATMDSPDQGATGIPVSRVAVAGDDLTLEVSTINGRFEGVLSPADSTIEGTWTQAGRSFPLTLSPADASDSAPPPRPQHPEPPFPYATEEVAFRNASADITLAGTLTLPDGAGPHPAVVLVSGSGPQNRDSDVFGHKLFLVLADHLTRHGIAVLRYDERGVGASGGSYKGATSEDLARDVAAAVRFVRERPEIDAGEVGLLGMSEGGLVAPMVHTRFEPVDFLVLMAGPSVPAYELLVEQSAAIAAARGASASTVDSIRRVQRRSLEAIRTAPDSATAARRLRSILEEQGVSQDQIQSQITQVASPWFRYFLRYEPGPVLQQVDAPVLALYAGNDVQVLPDQNVEPMRAALGASPSDDVTVRVIDGLNHLFQPAETGLPSRYAQIETTMAPVALRAITDWVQARTSAGG